MQEAQGEKQLILPPICKGMDKRDQPAKISPMGYMLGVTDSCLIGLMACYVKGIIPGSVNLDKCLWLGSHSPQRELTTPTLLNQCNF